MGDSHGKWKSFEDIITRQNITDAVIYHLGDGAFGFNKRMEDIYILTKLNDFCVNHNIILYNIHGNHDDPYFFKDEKDLVNRLKSDDAHVGDWTKNDIIYQKTYSNPEEFASIIKNLSNIKFVKDYEITNVNGLNILGIGGAISIDRISKRKKLLYFPEEEVTYNVKVKKLKNIDIVASHSSPIFCEPFEISDIVHDWAYYDRTLLAEIDKERKLLAKIYDELSVNNKIVYYFYGHFHQNYKTVKNDTTFICLPPIILIKI